MSQEYIYGIYGYVATVSIAQNSSNFHVMVCHGMATPKARNYSTLSQYATTFMVTSHYFIFQPSLKSPN